MRRALFLGTHSFVDGGSKVGMQHLAEGLARSGWQVDYIATASSPFDLWGSQRHARLRRVWLQRQDTHGVAIEPGLTEYAFKTLFPAHRQVLRHAWQLKTFGWLLPRWLRTREYDVCIHEASPNVLFFPMVRSTVRIFRLADWPDGFAHEMPAALIARFGEHLRARAYDEIWAVSQPLSDYAREVEASSPVLTLPNGVEPMFSASTDAALRRPRSALFLGGLSAWLDMTLVHATARLLPDWTFDLYGPGSGPPGDIPANVRYHAPVPRQGVADLLARHEVGLIPLKESHGRMRFVERPLKFYEYMSAGLGVASTDVGALRHGMGPLAAYGNTPPDFAQAILAARQQAQARTPQDAERFMQAHSWPSVVARVRGRLDTLMAPKNP